MCDQGGLPPKSSSPLALAVWERPARHQTRLGNMFTHVVFPTPQILRLLFLLGDDWLWLADPAGLQVVPRPLPSLAEILGDRLSLGSSLTSQATS